MPRHIATLIALALLAACNATATTREPVTVIDGGSLDVSDAQIAATPLPDRPVDVVTDPEGAMPINGVEATPGGDGLVERQPDTCGAADSQSFVGQPATAFPDPGRPLRLIVPGAIVTQEYDPMRINLHLDEAGTITRISCG